MDMDYARRIAHYLFLAVTVLMLVSGLGVTQYQTVELPTLGLLGKALSFQLHNWLVWPFVILLALHVYMVLTIRRIKEKKK